MVQDDGETMIARLEAEKGGPLEVLQPGVSGAAGSRQQGMLPPQGMQWLTMLAVTCLLRSTGSDLYFLQGARV